MATTQFATGDTATVKLWSDRLYYDVTSDKTLIGQMKRDGSIKIQEDTARGAGDNIKYFFLNRISSKGLIGDQSATGNESALVYADDNVSINELRKPIQIPVKRSISSQRVNFDLDENGYEVLRNWMIERQTVGVINQLAGFNPTTFTYDGETYTGDDRLQLWAMNTPKAPSTTRIIRANNQATDLLVNGDATATLKLSYIDQCEQFAEKNRPYIMPLNLDGGIKYRFYVHTDGFLQLIQDTTAPMQYRDLLLSQMAAGTKKEALIGRSFVYSQTEIIATDKMPNGVTSSAVNANTRRAVFVGKEAGVIAYGQGFSDGKDTTAGFSFTSDEVDIQKWKRIAVVSIFGSTKAQFNSVDRASIVVTHYVL